MSIATTSRKTTPFLFTLAFTSPWMRHLLCGWNVFATFCQVLGTLRHMSVDRDGPLNWAKNWAGERSQAAQKAISLLSRAPFFAQLDCPPFSSIIRRGVRGLDDKSHAPKHPKRKMTLDAINEVRKLQENPELGEWRVHAALKDIGIKLSPRTCSRILALNRNLYGMKGPKKEPKAPKEMPFKASRRHEYGTVDVRYIEDHLLGPDPIYSITIMDNFSRAIIASAISPKQDLTAYLIVLYSAIRLHGAPKALVSDNGSIFKAKQAMQIYEQLGIRKEFIAKRQPWMSYIETTFNIQRRMGDFHFNKAKTWEDMRVEHDRWVADYNYQVHWAHRHREDKRHSPTEVLGGCEAKSGARSNSTVSSTQPALYVA